MFSLSKYSPKSLLAGYLSRALAAFFDVDPAGVEANLVRDAKVVLNDIAIKEQDLGDATCEHLRVSGQISQIEFSWAWDSSAVLMKDVRLAVRGVSVHARVVGGDDRHASSTEGGSSAQIPEASAEYAASNEEAPPDWKAKYLQQIVDHLTLAISDVALAIHLDEESQVVLQTKDIELITLAGDGSAGDTSEGLLQKMSLGSVESWIERGEVLEKHPILEPFGYAANIARISGRRFLDGILSGLLVEGEPGSDSSHAPSTVRVHAGVRQIEGLNSLQRVLLLVGQDGSGETSTPANESLSGSDTAKNNAEMKSIFRLPFRSMEVVLENNTNLSLAGCKVRYCTDGSELSVDCCGGVWVDGTPLSNDGRWTLDLASSELSLDALPSNEEYEGDFFYSTHSDGDAPPEKDACSDEPFRLNLTLDVLRKVYSGVVAIMPQCAEARETAEQAMERFSEPSSSASSWTVKCPESVAFRFTGESDVWVEILAKAPKLRHEGTTSFDCASVDINSKAAGFGIHIPQISTDKNGRICVEYRIAVTVDSVDTFQTLQTMWNQISDIIGDKSSGSAGSPGIPVAMSLAGLDVTLKEPKGSLHVSRIAGVGTEWSIGVLQVNNVGNASFDANSLRVSLDVHKTTVFIQRIKRLTYDKVEYLERPIDDTTVVVENNEMLSVAFKDVCINGPSQVAASSNDGGATELSLPLPLHITVERLRATSDAGNVELDGMDFWARPTSEMLMLDLELNALKARVKDTVDLSCGKINTSVEVGTSSADEGDSEVTIPGLGHLSSASVTIHDVMRLSSPSGVLSKPLDVVEVNYGGGTVMVKMDKVLFCPSTGGHSSNGGEFSLPVALYFEVNRLVAMPEFGPGLPGLCFDGLRVHLTPGDTTVGVKVQCTGFQGRGAEQASVTGKGMRLSLEKSLLGDNSGFLGVTEAHVSMKELSTLSMPGYGLSLARPVCNPVVELINSSVGVKCDLVHLSHAQTTEQESEVDQNQTAAAEFVEIPLPFSIEVKQLIVASPTSQVICDQFSTQYLKAPTSTSKSVHVGVASLSQIGSTTFKANGISVSTKWQDIVEHESVSVPYLGSLSFAQAELELCTEMTTSSFTLVKPIQTPKMLFREGFVVLELTDLHLDAAKCDDNQQQAPQQGDAFDVGMIRVPIGFNVSNTLRIKTAAFDALLEKVGIDVVRSPASSRGEVFIHVDRLVESRTLTAANVDLNIHLSLPSEMEAKRSVIPGIEIIDRASVRLGEVTNFSVEGTGRLTPPLKNTVISYQDGVLATELATAQFECPCLEKGLVLGLKRLNLKIQQDPFDQTVRFMIQSDTISGHGDASFGASGVSLIATLVPNASEEVIAAKPVTIPSFGYASLIVLDVDEIPMLSVARTGHLKSPVTKFSVRFENDVITLRCPSVFAQRTVVADSISRAKHQRGGKPAFELPCKTIISVEAVRMHESFEHKAVHREIRCSAVNVTLEPVKVLAGQQHQSIRGPGLGFQFIGSDLKSTESSTVVDVPRLSASGLLQLNDFATVGNLSIGMEKAQLAAEFASPNWSENLEEPPAVIRLPYASIPKFELTLRCAGKLLNIDDATINCDQFQGSANSTSSQLSRHYVSIVKGRIPFLLSKTDVAGCNVADSVGVMAGKVLTHTSVVGATVGVASRDVVGSTLTAGKEARGASAHDKYQFGDFSRGVVISVKHAAKSGAQMRGDDVYRVGDFTSGTAKAAGSYASENRCRLAGAGGSAMGMVAGAALMGPVGFVAGSLIGGSAAKSSMAALTGDPKKQQQALANDSSATQNQSSGHTGNDTNATQHQPCNQAPDLLSSDYQQNVPPATAPPRSAAYPPPSHSLQHTRQGGAHHRVHPPHQHSSNSSMPASATAHAREDNDGHDGYRFGDVTRGIIARGKKADGRDDSSGYKFGDFTRGLFK